MHSQQISMRMVGGLALGLVAAGPAVAAPSMGGVDWGPYLNWHAYTDWHSLLLIGSIALLMLALLVKGVEAAKSGRASSPIPTPAQRIGTMPIEPPAATFVDEDKSARGRPYRMASSSLSTAG